MADDLKPGGLDTWGAITAVHGEVERNKALQEAIEVCEWVINKYSRHEGVTPTQVELGRRCVVAIMSLKTKEKTDE